jgi:hypothetical protein
MHEEGTEGLNTTKRWVRRNPVEKRSKNRLGTIRSGPRGLRADIGSLKRFYVNRHLASEKVLFLSGSRRIGRKNFKIETQFN